MTNPVDFSYDLTMKFIESYGSESVLDYAPMEDGPHTCVCKPGFTPIFDDEDHLIACFDCKEIDVDCISCSKTDTCDQCGSLDRMLSPDGTKCVDKLNGCTIKPEDQPDLLHIKQGEEGDYYMCPQCSQGYFWSHNLK